MKLCSRERLPEMVIEKYMAVGWEAAVPFAKSLRERPSFFISLPLRSLYKNWLTIGPGETRLRRERWRGAAVCYFAPRPKHVISTTTSERLHVTMTCHI